MNYYDYNYGTPTISNAISGSLVWIIISLVIAVIGGIALYVTFLNKNNEGKYKGFLGKIYDFFNFKYFLLEDIFKILYLMSAIALTLLSFSYIASNFWKFLAVLILGNVGLRITFELSMLWLDLCHNVREINDKTKK